MRWQEEEMGHHQSNGELRNMLWLSLFCIFFFKKRREHERPVIRESKGINRGRKAEVKTFEGRE